MSIVPKRLLSLGIVAVAVIAGRGVGINPQALPPREVVARSAEASAFGAIYPRLSPAGDRIAFSYQGAIWRMPRTGGKMTRLTGGSGFDIEPVWSPDGGRIAYLNSQAFGSGVLRITRAEDGASFPLPKEVRGVESLSFGPEGTRLLGKFQGPALAWLDLNNGELTPVRTGALRPDRYALSLDGRRIAFTTTQDVPDQQAGNDG